jgi:hypothetical protein
VLPLPLLGSVSPLPEPPAFALHALSASAPHTKTSGALHKSRRIITAPKSSLTLGHTERARASVRVQRKIFILQQATSLCTKGSGGLDNFYG